MNSSPESISVKPCENGYIIEVCIPAADGDIFSYTYKKYIYNQWAEVIDYMTKNPVAVFTAVSSEQPAVND